jgi:long-chain acyl-CoA synthetase
VAIVPRQDADLAALMYTGGTTGRAKGVMLSHENLWLAGQIGESTGYVPGIVRALTALPLAHAFGLLVTVVGLHSREPGTTVLMRWFDPTSWLELAQKQAAQISAVVPSMLQLLLALPLEDYDLSALRQLACGAAPLPAEVVDEFARRVPWVEIREGYGLTETSALASANRPGRIRHGSVGQPVEGTEVMIVDEHDRELPIGEVGEICCSSRTVMLGYWREPELTTEVMRGGRLHTGDMGRVDKDGCLYVVDRKKDLIIRGGFNVFPRDVEEALLEHPAIAAACVVGRPDEVHGEEIVAFVSLRAGQETPADELRAFGRTRLEGYKWPRDVRVLPSLPFTPVGKVDRKALRARLAAEGGTT